jgi:putative hemolysin
MNTKKFLVLVCLLVSGCAQANAGPGQEALPPSQGSQTGLANMSNPASVHCQQQGHTSEIRTADDGSQSGVCIFTDGSECDEWAYYRGECLPASQSSLPSNPVIEVAKPTPAPAVFPTALPIDPGDYQGWWTYTQPVYGFSIMLPEDWIAEESTGDPLLNDHMLTLHPGFPSTIDFNIRMTFRRIGEEVLLWPTGVGGGEFLPQGTVDVDGQPARRIFLICPTEEINSIWYQGKEQPNIQRSDLEFGFITNHTGVFCQEGYGLSQEAQYIGDMIIASLSVP